MSNDRLFLDTAFIQALLNPRDDYHNKAKQLFPRFVPLPKFGSQKPSLLKLATL